MTKHKQKACKCLRLHVIYSFLEKVLKSKKVVFTLGIAQQKDKYILFIYKWLN